jgi:hypothetical protein
MSEVIKIKIALLFGFSLQLVYLTWFLATSFGELRQEIGIVKVRIENLERQAHGK